ncbi:MAG: MotA/TolQ/ExbB proton channel family protein [Planctomycetota bacterium]|nr:MAG: MotA/TolQ/ExbB proton channel family protein [Planctomycetota bacterium]
MIAHILANAGIILWLIGACSLVALAVVLERLRRLLPLRRQMEATWMAFESWLQDQRRGACPQEGDPLARVIGRGRRVQSGGRDAVRIAALEAAQREVPSLERGLGVIAVVAQVTPLLGLLGTVAGLMEAFEAAGQTDTITHAHLATGIYKALGTTAAGLGVAIPAYIAYTFLAGMANRLVDQLETVAVELPLLLVDESES